MAATSPKIHRNRSTARPHVLPSMTQTLVIVLTVVGLASAIRNPRAPGAKSDWSLGELAWRHAKEQTERDEDGLWTELNACDPVALQSAVPLTVLFGVSSFWQEIEAARAKRKDAPFEVHVIGASYPFEGRADWNLLASRKPPHIPAVRVVLVMGTPWQDDNVPKFGSLMEIRQDTSSTLSHTNRRQRRLRRLPIAGHYDQKVSEVVCDDNGNSKANVKLPFKKEDVCRNHGNGLEVICIEKLYQDVDETLPKPDVAVMFNPGFPQVARRSWDLVLRKLLEKNVTMFVSTETSDHLNAIKAEPVGGHHQMRGLDEDREAFITLKAYEANSLGLLRNPFPIYTADDDLVVAKNIVLQTVRGYRSERRPRLLSPDVVHRDQQFLQSVDWPAVARNTEKIGLDLDTVREIKDALSTQVSVAYEDAMHQMYVPRILSLIDHRGGQSTLSDYENSTLSRMGVLAPTKKRYRWGPKTWLWLLQNLSLEV